MQASINRVCGGQSVVEDKRRWMLLLPGGLDLPLIIAAGDGRRVWSMPRHFTPPGGEFDTDMEEDDHAGQSNTPETWIVRWSPLPEKDVYRALPKCGPAAVLG